VLCGDYSPLINSLNINEGILKEPAVMKFRCGFLLGVPFHNFCYGLVGVAYFLESLL
jgi:hypothetical protein